MELKIEGQGGANGASVAWHPVQKKYYAAMAGNATFPLNIYNDKGTRLSPDDQETLFDVRGLWYNPNTKTLQANGYNEFGWGEYTLDSKGMPDYVNTLVEAMHQPNAQSTGALNPAKKKVYFLNAEGALEIYNYPDGTYDDLKDLRLSVVKKDDDGTVHNEDVIDNYNSTTIVFTGIKNAEIGLLNYVGKQIELYNEADGYMTQKLILPNDAPVNALLNFAYANGIFWLFDKTERKWVGFK